MEKCNNTKLEGDQFLDERTPLAIRNFHDEDVTSMSNLEMILELVLHSFV